MEIHQLRYFVSVAQVGNFTRAAEKCLVAQPSLSQQIIKLEKELGGPLLDRTGRTVRLTDAGRKLYSHAVEILASIDAAKSDLLAEDGAGRVAIGAIPTVAPYLLPPLLKSFTRRFPEAEVSVWENLTAHSVKACLDGDLDIAFLALPIETNQLAVEVLFVEELLLAMAPGHALEKKRRITIKDISQESFVLLSEAHCLGEQVLSFCKQKDCLPAVSCHGTQLLTVQELVALGQGVSLIPSMAAAADKTRKRVYRSLSGHPPQRTIAVVWRRDRHQSALVRQLIDHTRLTLAAQGP